MKVLDLFSGIGGFRLERVGTQVKITKRSHLLFQLVPSVHRTTGIGFGLFPTMGANEYKGVSRKRFRGSPHFRGAKTSEGLRTTFNDPIYLSPSFAEAIVGFPIGWTDLKV